MDRLHPFPAMNNGAPSLTPSSNSSASRTLAIAGLFTAALAAYNLCQPVHTARFGWSLIILRAAWYISLTAIAGAAGVWAGSLLLRAPTSFTPTWLSAKISVGWVFLPCIALLYHRHSYLMLLFVALTMLLIALSLRAIHPEPERPSAAVHRLASELSSLYGLPPADSQLSSAISLALCTQATLYFVFRESLFFASLPLAAAIFLLTWRWSVSDPATVRRLTGRVPRAALIAIAVFLTVFVLLPPFPVSGEAFGLSSASGKSGNIPRYNDDNASGYVGIILVPPPVKKKVEIIAPSFNHSVHAGALAQPIRIPFDGPYWYFRAPFSDPGVHPHLANAKPTEVNIHSTDFRPMRMEAHQSLGLPIALTCCSAISVSLTNADHSPGPITVALRLTDSGFPGSLSLDLPSQPLVSSQDLTILPTRPPVAETLHFTLPPSSAIQRFDRITVILTPGGTRSRLAPRVSIQGFDLIP